MCLIDTNLLSKEALGRGHGFAELVEWMDERSDALFLSATTVAEVRDGISRLRRNGATNKAAQLTDWLDVVVHPYGDRVIPFDIAAARLTGALIRGTCHRPFVGLC